ncbi:hypothetical protein [Saccharothrix luteola]|uniref:hypothetical protein n=1 Tax=Saccharothrix luteola TaxID=2893018 RepID=UPI001E635351|nr:hypothetical protein [Saccharothrix luteola]MCC8246971.1 hypothetical protein [Saccharothrix luteola]
MVVQAGGDVNLRTGARVRTRYRFQVERIAPVRLEGREEELAELAAFCLDPATAGGYRWWQAGPWAGKSALLSWFVLHPPPCVRVVSFFVTARLAGQSDRTAFVDNVLEQLLTILGEDLPPFLTPATREPHLLGLLDEAAHASHARGESLLLVVDGLDEDRGVTTGPDAHSIAGLLPLRLPAGMRVIVAGRPDPPIPGDVHPSHLLRDPGTVRVLDVSARARVLRDEMENELLRLLDGAGPDRDVLGLLTAAGGGLTAVDLAALTDQEPWQVRRRLRTVAGRSFARRPGSPSSAPVPEVYVLGHEQLQVTAVDMLGPGRLHSYRGRLHAWAQDYRDRGWPSDTPQYLLRGYPTMLLGTDDLERVMALGVDPRRHRRLHAVTGSDNTAVSQIAAAIDAHLARGPVDLAAVGRLAAHRDRLADLNTRIPVLVPALWARLGHDQRALALAQSISTSGMRGRALQILALALAEEGRYGQAVEVARSVAEPDRRAEALLSLAGVQAATGADRPVDLIEEALTISRTVLDGDRRNSALILVAMAFTDAGDHDRALDVLDEATRFVNVAVDGRGWALEAVAVALAEIGHYAQAREVLDAVPDADQRDWGLGAVVDVMANANRVTEAVEAARSIVGATSRIAGLTAVAKVLVATGRHRDAVALMHAESGAVERSRLARSIVEVLLAEGLVDDAVELVWSVPAVNERIEAAVSVAQALTGQPVRRDEVVDQAAHLALGVVDSARRLVAITTVAASCARVGRIEQAVGLARSVDDPVLRSRVERSIATAAAEAGFVDQAVRLARSARGSDHAVAALTAVADILIRSTTPTTAHELLEQARETALGILDEERGREAIALVTRSFVLAGRRAEAIALIRMERSADRRDILSASVALLAARAGHHDDALEVADMIDDQGVRDDGYSSIAMVLQQAGHHRRATDVIGRIVETGARDRALSALVRDLVETTSEHASSIAVVRSITDPDLRSRNLAVVAEALIGSGNRTPAELLLDEAVDVARSVVDLAKQSQALAQVGRELDLARHPGSTAVLDRAIGVARSIDDDEQRDDALAAVVHTLVGATDDDVTKRLLDMGESVTRLIGASYLEYEALLQIAERWAEVGEQGRAAATARLIASRWSEDDVFVESLVHVGQLDEAESVARDIVSRAQRDRALTSVVRGFGNAGQHTEALAAAQSIGNVTRRDHALVSTVRALVATGAHDKALSVANAVIAPGAQAGALVSVARSMIAAGHANRGSDLLDQAAAVARSVSATDPDAGEDALLSVFAAMAEAGRTDDANATLNLITQRHRRCEAFLAAANAAIAADDPAHADAFLARADDAARSVTDAPRRDSALWSVAVASTKAGRHTRAAAATRAISDPMRRCRNTVALWLARSETEDRPSEDLIEEALEIARSAGDVDHRNQMVKVVVRSLVASGRFGAAIKAIEHLTDGTQGWELSFVAAAKAATGDLDGAVPLVAAALQRTHWLATARSMRLLSADVLLAVLEAATGTT